MLRIRLIPLVVIGALMMGIVFASTSPKLAATPDSALTMDQAMAIEKGCEDQHEKTLTSEAFQNCVETREAAALAKSEQK